MSLHTHAGHGAGDLPSRSTIQYASRRQRLNALILEKTRGVTVSEEDVEEALNSLLFETSCRFVMRDVSGHRRRNEVWYSDPFYSGPQGYKMRLQVYANGVDEVRGEYCSVFIQLLEGEFDSRLTWPCCGRADVILLDQFAGRPNNIGTINFTFAQPVGGLPVAASTRPTPPTAHSLSTRSGLPPKPLKVGGRRRRPNRSPQHNFKFNRAYSAGLERFVELRGGYSPYEINNYSWYEVSDVHII